MLLFCGACSSDPDVLATSKAQPPPTFDLVSNCEEGKYRGSFDALPSMSEILLPLSGVIDFSLARSQLGELLQWGDTRLEGRDTKNSNAKFEATIKTGRCEAGTYDTQIKDGKFAFLLADGGIFGDEIQFEGNITGEYVLEHHSFYGEWHTESSAKVKIGGRWSAYLVQ